MLRGNAVHLASVLGRAGVRQRLTRRRGGGGTRLGPRVPELDIEAGGGRRRNTSACPLEDRNMKRQYPLGPRRADQQFAIRAPRVASFSGMGQVGGVNPTGMMKSMLSGVRWCQDKKVSGQTERRLPQRWQLVKFCKFCHYHTDGLHHMNLCTRNNEHWHKKVLPSSPIEGYRPVGPRGSGGRHIARTEVTKLPIHRLGALFPVCGSRRKNWGNPAHGYFDKWLIWRRFHKVGSPYAKWGYTPVFPKDL
eukprot:TRINITY_DN15814_c0_g1_i1.p1 TRINITY_DN15814_c0_g1~~TRINITY_DN15814_c0_g1_i1.p1  ORF type:complete len:249 (+),score=0.99 TRINITY_DN15814_c0_g1_i1:130-876(+)